MATRNLTPEYVRARAAATASAGGAMGGGGGDQGYDTTPLTGDGSGYGTRKN